MSQEKVNQYKEEKKNRKETMKKEKRKSLLMKICGVVVLLALAVWIGYSAVEKAQSAEAKEVVVDDSAIRDYYGTLAGAEE